MMDGFYYITPAFNQIQQSSSIISVTSSSLRFIICILTTLSFVADTHYLIVNEPTLFMMFILIYNGKIIKQVKGFASAFAFAMFVK